MTLEEIKKARLIAEMQINRILTNFTKCTGVSVDKVKVDYVRNKEVQHFLQWEYPYDIDIILERI